MLYFIAYLFLSQKPVTLTINNGKRRGTKGSRKIVIVGWKNPVSMVRIVLKFLKQKLQPVYKVEY
jgi:hypothetical protein